VFLDLDYPRVPPKQMRSLIQLETNALLAQIHNQRVTQITEGNDIATINRNSEVVDAPLVRAFNFLREYCWSIESSDSLHIIVC
jgi:hypothetical protein